MKVWVRIDYLDYQISPPAIFGVLRCENWWRDATDGTVFTSPNRTGTWKIHDYMRGGPPPAATGEQKMGVVLKEIGVCDPLQVGDELAAVDDGSTCPAS